MTVVIRCSGCERPLQLAEAALGKRVRCPACAAVFTAQAVSDVQATPPTPAPAPAFPTVATPPPLPTVPPLVLEPMPAAVAGQPLPIPPQLPPPHSFPNRTAPWGRPQAPPSPKPFPWLIALCGFCAVVLLTAGVMVVVVLTAGGDDRSLQADAAAGPLDRNQPLKEPPKGEDVGNWMKNLLPFQEDPKKFGP